MHYDVTIVSGTRRLRRQSSLRLFEQRRDSGPVLGTVFVRVPNDPVAPPGPTSGSPPSGHSVCQQVRGPSNLRRLLACYAVTVTETTHRILKSTSITTISLNVVGR